MNKTIKGIVDFLGPVAPAVSALVGGPAGILVMKGMKAVSDAVGAPAGTPAESLLKSLQAGEFDETKLRAADAQLENEHREELERIREAGVADARKMRVSLGGDTTSSILAFVGTGGFIGAVAALFGLAYLEVQLGEDVEKLIYLAIGQISGMATGVFAFFFGSSKNGSK